MASEKPNFRTLDIGVIVDAIDEVNQIATDDIYANWVGVFRRGALLGFIVEREFRPVSTEMQAWWQKRTELDDENP